MSNNNHHTDSEPEPGICVCRCNYYFWMSLGLSVLTFLVFPVVQFIYGIDIRNTNTSIEGVMITVADWLLVDGLISAITGIMAIIILKNSDTVPNIIKVIFNTCIFFLFGWTLSGTAMLFLRIPIIVHGLAVIYNYIMLTAYIAYFVASIKYKDYVAPLELNNTIRRNEPHHDMS